MRYVVPIHQLAEYPRNNAGIATPNAAGLNTCFFFIAKINFDAIAQTDA